MFNNKENLRKYYREYYKKNKGKYYNYIKKYQTSEKGKKKIKEYRKKNKEKINSWRRKYDNERNKRIDIKIRQLLMIRLNRVIKRYLKTGKIIPPKMYSVYEGIDKNKFSFHQRVSMGFDKVDYAGIIKKLEPIPKDFYKKYQIDHIKPLCSFNLSKEEEVQEAFSPKNIQILTIKQNQLKGKKII